MTITTNGESVSFQQMRGAQPVASAGLTGSGQVAVAVPSTVEGSFSATTQIATIVPSSSFYAAFNERDVVFAEDHVTGNMLFASQRSATYNSYELLYWRGEYSQWYTLHLMNSLIRGSHFGDVLGLYNKHFLLQLSSKSKTFSA